MTRRVVVGAAVIRAGRVLAARRTRPPELAGRWEFPGGKVERDESERSAVVRECQEELSVAVVVTDLLGRTAIDERIELALYLAHTQDEPRPGCDHDELRWLGPGELVGVDWLDADRTLLPLLNQRAEFTDP